VHPSCRPSAGSGGPRRTRTSDLFVISEAL
jgi:hypothetical protein